MANQQPNMLPDGTVVPVTDRPRVDDPEALKSFAVKFVAFAKANGVTTEPLFSAQTSFTPAVGFNPSPLLLTWKPEGKLAETFDVRLLAAMGSTGLDEQMRHLLIVFDVRGGTSFITWDQFTNPKPVENKPPAPASLVGGPIPNQPGFYYRSILMDGLNLPAGTPYVDPVTRGKFVWVEGLFGGNWFQVQQPK